MSLDQSRTPQPASTTVASDPGGQTTKPASLALPVERSNAVGLEPAANSTFFQPPSISVPSPGGSIRSLGEKFSVNAVNGTSAVSIPITTTSSRGGSGPALSLSYD